MKWIKYLLVILVVLALCVWSMQFFISSDQFSKMLSKKMEESINGTFDIDDVDFDFYPSIGFKIKNLSLKDQASNEVLNAKEAVFGLMWSSLISFKPRAAVQIDQASLNIIQAADGQTNINTIFKKSKTVDSPSLESKKETTKESSGNGFLDYLLESKIDLLLNDAVLTMTSPTSSHEFKRVFLSVSDIGLNDIMRFRLSHTMTSKQDSSLKIDGKNSLIGELLLTSDGLNFSEVDLKAVLNSEDLDIKIDESFHKPEGQDLALDIELKLKDKQLTLNKLDFNIAEALLQVTGTVSDLYQQKGLNLDIQSNKMSANQLTNLVSQSAATLKSGYITISGKLTGDSDNLSYNSLIKLNDFVSKQPGLRNDVKADGTVKIKTDELENLNLKINSGKSNFDIAMKAKHFNQPNIDLTIRANGIDLNDLLEGSTKKESTKKQSPSAKSQQSASSSLDKTLIDLGKDPFIKKTNLKFDIKAESFEGLDLSLTDISLRGKMRQSIVYLDSMSWKGYKGAGDFSGKLDLSHIKPRYDGKLKVKNVHFESLVKQFSPRLQNTAAGTFYHDAQFKGVSLEGDAMLKALDVSGKFSLDNGVFRTVDVVKMTNNAINGGLKGVKKAFAWLKLPNKSWVTNDDSKYEFMRGNFNLKNGVLRSKVFNAKSQEGKGLDIEGDTVINLLTDDLKADWFIIDTYNHTKLKDIKAEFKGVQIKNILMDSSGVLKLPVSVGCKVSKPCYKYDKIPTYFTQNVAANVETAIKGQVKKRIQKEKAKVMKKIQGKADKAKKHLGGKAKKEVNKVLKRFGF